MFIASLIITLLIVTTPVTLIFDGPIIHGLVMAAAAISLAIVAVRIRPGEAGFLSSVVRPIAIVAAVPALMMVVQVLPLKAIGLANPIWTGTAEALGQPIAGSISIDPGATLVALARYLSVAAIAFVAAAVASDRRRAGQLLHLLSAATAVIALMVIAGDFASLPFPANSGGYPVADAATDVAGLGVIIALAAASHTLERTKMTWAEQGGSGSAFSLIFFSSLVSAAMCAMAVILGADREMYFAVACGAATLAVAAVMRRYRFGPWGYSAIVSVAIVVVVAAVVLRPSGRITDLTVAFASRASAPLAALTQRMVTETGWAGTGAGTFAAVLPIYRDINELAAGGVPPTAAAAISVEMGRPFLWAIFIAAIALVAALLRGALRRGRDSVFATVGAGCVVALTLMAFGNVGVFSTPVLLTAAVLVGTAIVQRRSRSA